MVSPALTPEVFATPFIWVNLCRIGKVRRPLWHGALVSILLSTKLDKDVKQTKYSVCDAFYRAKNIGDQCKEPGISLLTVERINMI